MLGSTLDSKGKIWHFSDTIWSTFVTVLWFSKTEIADETGILALVRVLWDVIFKILWQFWHSFFKNTLESSYNFCPIEMMFNLFDININGNMTFVHYDVSLYQRIRRESDYMIGLVSSPIGPILSKKKNSHALYHRHTIYAAKFEWKTRCMASQTHSKGQRYL